MPVSHARAAAFEILMRVEQTGAYASELLHASKYKSLSPADHGLLTELVMGVLRWRGLLDEEIAKHLRLALSRLDIEVLTALRLGVYQILFLDRIPAHAASNESVKLVKRARKKSAAGMVNAVLRKVALENSSPSSPKSGGRVGQPGFLQKRREIGRRAHPEWMVKRWEQFYGSEVAHRICEYNLSAPGTIVRVEYAHASKISKDEAPSAVATGFPENIQLETGKIVRRAAVVVRGEITRTEAYREHRLMIQDEGSQLVALLVGEGNNILDCCAAPGGKARILAWGNPASLVVAMELHPHRGTLLKKLVPEANVKVLAADARTMPFRIEFDRILVDAPCSGTGTLARNPEIKWRLKPEDMLRLQGYQMEILSAAMARVAAAGRIVYSTCSLEPEENEQVIERALRQHDQFRVVDARERLLELSERDELAWKDIDSLVSGPYLRTLPGLHPCDGFFAAVLERKN